MGDGCISLQKVPPISVISGAVIEYPLSFLLLSRRQIDRLKKIINEAMWIILRCTRGIAVTAIKYPLNMFTIGFKWQMCQATAYLHVGADKGYLLHEKLQNIEGTRY